MSDFNTIYDNYFNLVNNYLKDCINDTLFPENKVVDAMKYSLLSNGKRIRPILFLGFCDAFSQDINKCLPLACAIEMIHCYSLIHDDLPCMDNDDLRRGLPTCHVKFGEDIALLAGDALLTNSFYTIASCDFFDNQKIEIIKLLSLKSGYDGMIGGQVIDIDSENKSISLDILQRMHLKKTSYLISASCEIASIVSLNTNRKKLSVFGEKLGLCFQILDDILDIVGEMENIGKPTKSDIKKNKSTYVSFFGIEKCREIAMNLSNECVDILKNDKDYDYQFLIDMVKYLLNRKF